MSGSAFIERLKALSAAGVAVLHVRTREPSRLCDLVASWADTRSFPVRTWGAASGWSEWPWNGVDGEDADLASDLRVLLASEQPACWIAIHPHHHLRSTVAVDLVRAAARLLTEGSARLLLVTPPGVELPDELRGDVPVLDLGPPGVDELTEAFSDLVDGLGDRAPVLPEGTAERVGAAGLGLTATDYDVAVGQALVAFRGSADADALFAAVSGARARSLLQSDALELVDPGNLDAVGGLHGLKSWLRRRAGCRTPEARAAGVEPPKGILLVGPPGTGKSAAARTSAAALGLPLVKFDISRVYGAYVGQSEQRVREALATLSALSPCVCWLDEIDKALPPGGGDGGVSRRILGAVLSWMSENTGVFVVATANRADALPAELLRRGRFDEVFAISVPDAAARTEIIGIHLRRRGRDPDQVPNLDAAVTASQNYVPAELEQAVRDALVDAWADGVPLTGGLIAAQLGVPLSVSMRNQFDAMASWAATNARSAA